MGRFDGRDDELTKGSKPVSNLFGMFLVGLFLGFIGGAVWGFFYFESLAMNDAFAQTIKEVSRPLDSFLGMSDSITVRIIDG